MSENDEEKKLTQRTDTEPIMYFVVNSDLKMGPGKIAGQVGHGAIESFKHSPRNKLFYTWDKGASAKVILTAPKQKMDELLEKYPDITIPIIDLGRTQIAPNSFTVLVFHIMPRNSNPDLVSLKLHK